MELLKLLFTVVPTPKMFGIYHIICIVLMFAVAFLICKTHKEGDTDRVRRFVFWTAIIVIVCEIYKQFYFSHSIIDGKLVFDYRWFDFPFQFCSLPMYVGLLSRFVKKGGKVYNSLLSFLATYAVFGGITVMVYPVQVFIGNVGVNIQTIVCHASMIVIGIYLYYSGVVKAEFKTLLKAMPVFAVSMVMAIVMNHIANGLGLNEGDAFNMFYISPFCPPNLPVYSMLQPILPYPVCLVIYFVGFTLIAGLILLIAMGVKKLSSKIKSKKVSI